MLLRLFLSICLFPISLFAAETPKDTGRETYEHFCITCHQDGVAGAPRFHDKKEWDARLAGRTIDDLVASAVTGLNSMPPQGTCTECTEDDIRAAITYMMPTP